MGLAVVTVAAGGLPVVDVGTGKPGLPVTEATSGIAITKLTGKPGMPVTFVTATGGPVVSGDPFFSNVVFLWEAENLTDLTGKAITPSGTGALSAAQKRFGATSFSNGTGGWSAADSPDWDLSATNTTPFTIEFSAYQIGMQTWEVLTHWDVTKSWWIRLQADGQVRLLGSSDGTSTFSLDVTTTGFGMTNGAWADICIEKDATGKVRFYRNGVFKFSATPANSVFFAAAGVLKSDLNGNPNGYVDHVRITKGVARYASDAGYTFVEAPWPTSA